MVCKKCGAEMENNARFCVRCGACGMSESTQGSAISNIANTVPSFFIRIVKKPLWIAIVCMVVIGIAIICVLTKSGTSRAITLETLELQREAGKEPKRRIIYINALGGIAESAAIQIAKELGENVLLVETGDRSSYDIDLDPDKGSMLVGYYEARGYAVPNGYDYVTVYDPEDAYWENAELIAVYPQNDMEAFDAAHKVLEEAVTFDYEDYRCIGLDGKATIISYVGPETTVVIPKWLGKYMVTRIGNNAFWAKRQNALYAIEHIELPASLTEIGAMAFSGTEVTEIMIPDSVRCIGVAAFNGCKTLNKINLPAALVYLGDGALPRNTLKEITLSPTNKTYYLEDGVLFDREKRQLQAYLVSDGRSNYEVPQGVTTIGASAFCDADDLISIDLPESVTIIADKAFDSCDILSEMTIPNSVQSIGAYAFAHCPSLKIIEIPGGVEKIAEFTFTGCTELTNVVLQEGVIRIGANAFLDCSSLAEISLPNGLQHIGDGAFENCGSLNYIAIPQSLLTMGDDALHNCPATTGLKK